MLNLTRPLIFLDLETTGTDPQRDRIVEFAAIVRNPTGDPIEFVKRFNPQIPIPPESTEVHGITDEDVAGCDPFSVWAHRIQKSLSNRDIAGFNVWYDIQMLAAEFERCGIEWDWRQSQVIDCGVIYKRRKPRTLEAAVQEFCGREHVGAHGALADAQAAYDVLVGQISVFGLEPTVDALVIESSYPGEQKADLAGKLKYVGGVLCYDFGEHRGKPVVSDRGFATWMLGKDFSRETKRMVQEALL